ncbi:MAG: hypothetical protein K0U64_05145 [Actinomycetia bacterium]|nr:hypothetical protein [Actinomycetes bacterium]
MSNPNLLLAAARQERGDAPAITWYGADRTRIELSYATLANAVAKTAGFLQEELELEPGDSLRLQLGSHWQTPVWISACAAVGLAVDLRSTADHSAAPLVSFSLTSLSQSPSAAPVLVSANPFGLPGDAPPDGIVDHAREVMLFPDVFVPEPDVHATFAIRDDVGHYGVEEVANLSSQSQRRCHLAAGTPTVTMALPETRAGWLTAWALPIFLGTHAVLCPPDLNQPTETKTLADVLQQEDAATIVTSATDRNQYADLAVSVCVIEQ